ncbi:MAG: hypothetical protein OHK0022_21250 [Roseiflexaceae bacterium]
MILERLIAAVRAAGCEPTGEQIAEALWMLQHLPAPAAAPGGAGDAVAPPAEPDVPPAPLTTPAPDVPPPIVPPPPATPAPAADVLAVTGATEGGRATSGGALIRVPGAPALPDAAALARALRPLGRRVALPNRTVLDVDATVRQLVERRIFRPVLRSERGRWLALHLLIDSNPSMGMWRALAGELRQLLLRRGVFRNVRVWALDPSRADAEPVLTPFGRAGGATSAARRPAALVDPAGRTLVLVVSDCVAPGWRSGHVGRALETWGRSGPAAVVQVLPERLWNRTSLGSEQEATLRTRAPGVPNAQLRAQVEDAWMFAGGLPRGGYAPLLALAPRDFAGWAHMLAGAPSSGVPGYLFAREPAASVSEDALPASAAERVERFLGSTSPLGIRLARLLAAAPVISLPIIRIVQAELLRDARPGPSHTAEVLLGGLLRPLLPAADPEAVIYDFVEGARELLLRQSGATDTRAVFLAVSDYIAANAGAGQRFPAVADVAAPAEQGEGQAVWRAFARATAAVLRELGHPELAGQLGSSPAEEQSAPVRGGISETESSTAPAALSPEQALQAVSEWLNALAEQIGTQRARLREAQTIEEQELAEDLSIAALHLQAARRALGAGDTRRLVRKLRLIERDLPRQGMPTEMLDLTKNVSGQIVILEDASKFKAYKDDTGVVEEDETRADKINLLFFDRSNGDIFIGDSLLISGGELSRSEKRAMDILWEKRGLFVSLIDISERVYHESAMKETRRLMRDLQRKVTYNSRAYIQNVNGEGYVLKNYQNQKTN